MFSFETEPTALTNRSHYAITCAFSSLESECISKFSSMLDSASFSYVVLLPWGWAVASTRECHPPSRPLVHRRRDPQWGSEPCANHCRRALLLAFADEQGINIAINTTRSQSLSKCTYQAACRIIYSRDKGRKQDSTCESPSKPSLVWFVHDAYESSGNLLHEYDLHFATLLNTGRYSTDRLVARFLTVCGSSFSDWQRAASGNTSSIHTHKLARYDRINPRPVPGTSKAPFKGTS